MKFKTSKKNMRDSYNKILKISYCNAQYLLQFEEPIAYSTRSESWACDYYDIDGVLISTGYAPLESKNVKVDYETVKKYDNIARDIIYSNINFEDIRVKVKELLRKFISEVIK